MSVAFLSIFVADKILVFGYNLAALLKYLTIQLLRKIQVYDIHKKNRDRWTYQNCFS